MTAIRPWFMQSLCACSATPDLPKISCKTSSCSCGGIQADSIGPRQSWRRLAVVARNRAIDALRKRRPETDIEDVIVSVAPDLAAAADRSRAAEKVRGVLGSMPPPQRSALEMAYLKD